MKKSISIPLLLLVAGLLAGSVFTTASILDRRPQPDIATTVLSPSPQPSTVATAGTPVRIIIPSINVDARVLSLGLDENGAVGAPEGPYDTAWYNLGPKPGQPGSSVITGHFGPWKNGAKSVFDRLDALKAGDTIQVRDDTGNTLTFEVVKMETYDATQKVPEIFNKNDSAYLNIITCSGDWIARNATYSNRLVVFTKLVT